MNTTTVEIDDKTSAVAPSTSFSQGARKGRTNLAAKALLWGILAVFASLTVWAALARVDDLTRAGGRVIPSAKLQVVQSLEGGIVRTIHVKAGDRVEAGALLVSLSPMQADGDYESRHQQVLSLHARALRLAAELAGREPVFPASMRRDSATAVAAEQAELLSRRDRHKADLSVLDAQLEQRRREAEDTRAVLATVEAALQVAQAEREIVSTMVERGLEPRLELVRQDGRLVDLEGKRASARLAIPRLQSAITEVRSRREAIVRQYRSDATAELTKVSAELSAQRKVMPALVDRLDRTELRAPVAGIVNRVFASTVGGVTKPGDAIAEVVPGDDQLVVEAHIQPKDIGFVHVGQTARVKLTAYDYAIFGSLEGKVTSISADAVQVDDKQTAYLARVETSTTALDSLGKKLPIIPGMQAEVNVITGNKTVLQYLTKPLVGLKENAFRER